jgi:hypothetical protein
VRVYPHPSLRKEVSTLSVRSGGERSFAPVPVNGGNAPTAVTYPNGGEPSLATHFGRSPSAEEEYEWRVVPNLRGPGATCLSPD